MTSRPSSSRTNPEPVASPWEVSTLIWTTLGSTRAATPGMLRAGRSTLRAGALPRLDAVDGDPAVVPLGEQVADGAAARCPPPGRRPRRARPARASGPGGRSGRSSGRGRGCR